MVRLSPAVYRFAAYAIAGVHFTFLVYVAVGGFLAWRWRRSVAAHLCAVAWATTVVVLSVPCPLTAAQNWLRLRAGQPTLGASFISHYLGGVMPALTAQILVATVVAGSWLGYRHREP
jgi:hypothetical protein